jgi:Family of unknown function (DUF5681)
MPENTGGIQENGRFKKGKSGNPGGKPKGARHKASMMAEMLFENEIAAVCHQVIDQAKEGNMQAAKIILDRLLPPRKDRPINFKLPFIQNTADALEASRLICHAVGNGEITPLEGESLSKIVEIHAKNIDLFNFGSRLEAIEKHMNQKAVMP